MREIKFRAWDTYNERMVDEPEKFIPTGSHHYTDDPRFNTPFQYYETWMDIEDGIHRPCHIMQYIGLKDKNGNEIFEGDILKHQQNIDGNWVPRVTEIYLVRYNSTIAGFEYAPLRDKEIKQWTTRPFGDEAIEVIGNAYQNPELITETIPLGK